MRIKKITADNSKCVGCKICEITCSNVVFDVNNPKKAAIHITKRSDPEGFEIKVCNQCGICAKKCPVKAIRLKGGIYVIDGGKCTRCDICVNVCPSSSIWLQPDVKVPLKCITCGTCVDNCPTGALSVSEVEI